MGMGLKKTVAAAVAAAFASALLPMGPIPTAEAKINLHEIDKTIGTVVSIFGGSKKKSSSKTKSKAYVGANDNEFVPWSAMQQVHQMFFMALEHKDYPTMQAMLDQGFNLKALYGNDDVQFAETPFYVALKNGNRDAMQWMLERGADITGFTKKREHVSYLASVAGSGDYDTVVYLHQWGAPINGLTTIADTGFPGAPMATVNYSGLNAAAAGRSPEIVKYFIDNGADIEHKTHQGDTPLLQVVRRNSSDVSILMLLLAAEADTTVRDRNGKSPLQIAMDNKNYNLTKILSQYPQ